MLNLNPIPHRLRIKELFFDYLVILAYLLILFILTMGFYLLVLGKIPSFNQWQSQLIASLTSVLPIVLLFTIMDARGGSLGKRKAGLALTYRHPPFSSAFIRNCIKFLPWQLGHMGTIAGVYTDYTSLTGLILTFLSIFLLVTMLTMGFCRKDKRHLGDLLAGTQVIVNPSATVKKLY